MSAFETGNTELHLPNPLDLAQSTGERRHILGEHLPFFALEAVLGGGLEDLDNGLARDHRPPPQPAHGAALRPALLRYLDEFGMALRHRREIEAVGFDNAPLRVADAVALAVRGVLHRHETGLDQLSVGCLSLRR